MEIWKLVQVPVDVCCSAFVGPLQLWVRRISDELHVAVKRSPNPDSHSEVRALAPIEGREPETLDWSRWVVGHTSDAVRLAPITPDKPLVVRPEVPLRLPTQTEALFFVNFPIFVGVGTGKDGRSTLCEEPCVVLSKTWFGDPMSGELCYAMRTRARRHVAETMPRPHRAMCPVRIRNAAAEQLSVERICVHVEHLSIYQGATRLWGNQVYITFRGEDEVSQVTYAEQPPEYEPVGEVLCQPRVPFKTTLLKRSLAGFGLLADNGMFS